MASSYLYMTKSEGPLPLSCYIRRFWNKCDIVEEPNSYSNHGIRVKFFSLITGSLGVDHWRSEPTQLKPSQSGFKPQLISLPTVPMLNFSFIPETSIAEITNFHQIFMTSLRNCLSRFSSSTQVTNFEFNNWIIP